MSSIRELTSLQSLDLELASRHAMLEEIRRQLEDTTALHELREALVREQLASDELERTQRAAEWEVEATEEHRKAEEKKLYAGTIKSAKELVDLDQEVALLTARQQQREDVVLSIMAHLEEQRARHSDIAGQLAHAEEERTQLEADLGAQRAQLEVEVQQRDTQRQALASRVPTKDLYLYGTLQTTNQGQAVARIERAICQGCRINLPITVQQRVRAAQTLVQCPSCGRLLFMD